MLKTLVLLVAGLSCGAAWGQQNSDTYFGFADPGMRAHLIDGASITADGAHDSTFMVNFGYQLKRVSATSLWLDIAEILASPDKLAASVPGGGSNKWAAWTAGVRLKAPIYGRLSSYAVVGIGGGVFHEVVVNGGPAPSVSTTDTAHPVFSFGGALDFRVLRWLSIRTDIRDVVTGNQLSGAAGRQHILPTFGLAFHI